MFGALCCFHGLEIKVLELVALFLLKTETCDAKNFLRVFVDTIFCLVLPYYKQSLSTKAYMLGFGQVRKGS